ncbi:hypothetical protein QMK33_08635 [Hymenobacter sp. H14-R3]|uniref:DUF6892 domain-containing protein n=1 Tax=Hymenobacter sp. H14-R3 TaxID=3046308 RepID=UPI0024BADAD0|nr:hypothetical protein [Hymenobacter sp. H14-R3]MDJ0365217.1 hypothetical protein [Hymenobacter sp. H14-R3]
MIQALLFDKQVLTSIFDAYDFAKNYTARKTNAEEIAQNGGDFIYHQLCSFWDGEDELFTIAPAADLPLVPHLRKVTLFMTMRSTSTYSLAKE